MAEIKNSFLKSKMNKDLDDRLVPNGEYRNAQNISVGKSEDDSIGALETILGNTLISFAAPNDNLPVDLKTIGHLVDEYNNTVYIFATNYIDGTNFNATPVRVTPTTKRCLIYSWSPATAGSITMLVDSIFLNFSTTNPIQATLIENLLFFTDNRNQPRKINVNKTLGFYTKENQISVAKYNPYQPISLIKKQIATVASITSSTVFDIPANKHITVGMSVVSTSKLGVEKILGSEYITVAAINGAGTEVTLSQAPALVANDPLATDIFTFLISTMTNKSADVTWPGDPDYLESKFVRFSYRFQYEDGEYSILAPFTQIAYIPKQKGYFINGDEDASYRSTILAWMENEVNNVELLIPLPDLASRIGDTYNIISVDILYKEADALIAKVLENLSLSSIVTNSKDSVDTSISTAVCTYNYQSRKPYKTLTQAQIVRVYDKTPVRTLAQETAGNRIIYGNFKDVYTPPAEVHYTIASTVKTTVLNDNWIEYPNHSLKQNRNYQVGFVLCDKFSRQSAVILSPVSSTGSSTSLGSTIFSPYDTVAEDVRAWFGDTLQVNVTQSISSGTPYVDITNRGGEQDFVSGEPGLYAIRTGTQVGWSINSAVATTITANVYTFDLTGTSNLVVPAIGDFLRGENTDYVEVITATNIGTAYSITTGFEGIANANAVVNSSYMNNFKNTPDIKYAYSINPNGWYSYKIVVKQNEQEYYNVYLPGIVRGYPNQSAATTPPTFISFPTNENDVTANVVLFNDNINKVPRDLTEVGPDQKQFRSSVQLFGRVQNTMVTNVASNIQYYPGTLTDTATSISAATDANMAFEVLDSGTTTPILYSTLSQEGQDSLYQLDTNPLIARLTTSQIIGALSDGTANSMTPFLAIYETEPVDSLLDIYWETTSVGMISDLNADIDTGYDGPTAFEPFSFSLTEDDAPGTAFSSLVYPVSNEGAVFDGTNPTDVVSFAVVNGNGTDVTNKFFLVGITSGVDEGKYQIKTMSTVLDPAQSDAYFVFENNSAVKDVYTFSITLSVRGTVPLDQNTIQVQASLGNINPIFTPVLSEIQKTVDETAIGTLIAFNGTNTGNAANSQTQLKWSITGGNPNNLDGDPAFSITPTGGVLTQIPDKTPNGLYTLNITLQDAVSSNVQGSGGNTIVNDQLVRIGPAPVNPNVISDCTTGPILAGGAGSAVALITDGINQNTLATAVWYVAAAVVADADLPVTPTTPVGVTTQTKFRLGSEALTQGQIVFSLNGGMTLVNGDMPPSGLQGQTTWKVWHRVNSGGTWAFLADINNNTIGTLGQLMDIQTGSTPLPVGNSKTTYKQMVLAYDLTGEYAIAAFESKSMTSNLQSQAFTAWVNSNDLNYSTCVIEGGTRFNSGNASNYKYGIEANPGSVAHACLYGTQVAYSNIPYGQYVQQFFTTTTLTTPYTFTPDAGGGISNYYAFKTSGASPTVPYDDASSYRFTFSTRFTIADAKVYVDPLAGTNCYTQNCGNTAVATTTCTPLQMNFPY